MAYGSILITGANGGLGSAFVSQFLNSAHASLYHGIYAVRNPSSAHQLHKILVSSPPSHSYEVISLDLGSLSNVRSVAESLNSRIASGTLPPIRALILNAAVRQVDGRILTTDGFEAHFGVNYLANFLFVLLLLSSMDKECGRVVCISTAMHDSYHWMNRHTFSVSRGMEMYGDTVTVARGGKSDEDTKGGSRVAGSRRYGTSKLLLVIFMYELQRRLSLSPTLSNISILTLDPGGMGGAELVKRGSLAARFFWKYIMPVVLALCVYFWPNGVLRTNSKSAGDLLQACFDMERLGKCPKAIYLNGSEKGPSSIESMDEEKQRQLWVDSLRLVGLTDRDTVLENWEMNMDCYDS